MSNPSEVARKFYINPDDESRAKSRFVYYYIGLYLKIIDNTRQSHPFAKHKKIVYLDLFAGEGKYGTGDESVPLKVLELAKEIENIKFYFNDLYRSNTLEENIKKKFGYESLPENIVVNSDDATKVNLHSLFSYNDIVISYVDSFSCLLCDTQTINYLIRNDLSDCILYLNMDFFFRWMSAENGEATILKFFGSDATLQRFRKLCDSGTPRDEITEEIIHDFITRLNLQHGSQLNYLPVYFRKNDADTSISQVILVVSKSDKGLVLVKERFTEVPKDEEDISGKIERDFYLSHGNITVYTDYTRDQMMLFDDEEEKYSQIMNYIPSNKEGAIDCAELLHRIDDSFVKKYGHISGYTCRFLRKGLTYFEHHNDIQIFYNSMRPRRPDTWGTATLFWKTEATR